jgi:hypothetical protein
MVDIFIIFNRTTRDSVYTGEVSASNRTVHAGQTWTDYADDTGRIIMVTGPGRDSLLFSWD